MRIDNQLTNTLLPHNYALELQPYEYYFFQIPADCVHKMRSVTFNIEARSGQAQLVLNEYLGTKPVMLTDGTHTLRFGACWCEKGENMLAYKGQLKVLGITVDLDETAKPSISQAEYPDAAIEFLLRSQIQLPNSSPFYGSCYAIYDYTNGCHRMPCWLWSDAPAVSAALSQIRTGMPDEQKMRLEQLAFGIGEAFLRGQATNPADEIYGALVSRHRYYGMINRSFNRLCGMNDTSYSVKWALLPLYHYTGDERYLTAAKIALDWVDKNLRVLDYVPSHYYHEDQYWEPRAFVDTGFCSEGFAAWKKSQNDARYDDSVKFLMDRFLGQFVLPSGFYGQNYTPVKGVDDRLFTRGQAWVLEGLIAIYQMNQEQKYLDEAKSLADKMTVLQLENGAWSYLIGYGEPRSAELENSGICEKATAVFAYLLALLHSIAGGEKYQKSAMRALDWCEANIEREAGEGYGGIAAASLSSGITGLPYLRVATGYANAYYLLARGLLKWD